MEHDVNTEEKILTAAKQVFIRKGMSGARMQEIADEAGINKSLLHYYFRSKDKLFEEVFRNTIKSFVPRIDMLLSSGKSFESKIQEFVNEYINLLTNNPHLPQFILHELNRDPERLIQIMSDSGIKEMNIMQHIESMLKENGLIQVDVKHFLINLIALCVFPFVARPIIEHVLLRSQKINYDNIIEERKTEIPKFILNSIKK